MQRSDISQTIGRFVRFAGTVAVTSAVTATIVMVLQPQPALPDQPPAATAQQDAGYPIVVGTEPAVEFDSEAEFLADYVRLRAELAELKRAIDYDADKGTVGPSVHEWADDREPGTFGGGRKP